MHDRRDDYVAPDGYKRCRRCHLDSAARYRERDRNGVRYVPPARRIKPMSRRQEDEHTMNLRALELMEGRS